MSSQWHCTHGFMKLFLFSEQNKCLSVLKFLIIGRNLWWIYLLTVYKISQNCYNIEHTEKNLYYEIKNSLIKNLFSKFSKNLGSFFLCVGCTFLKDIFMLLWSVKIFSVKKVQKHIFL